MPTITNNLIKAYFDQEIQYFSESDNAMIKIKDMHPTYAANAARRLLLDAQIWQNDALGEMKSSSRWMLNTKLYRALAAQSAQN